MNTNREYWETKMETSLDPWIPLVHMVKNNCTMYMCIMVFSRIKMTVSKITCFQ